MKKIMLFMFLFIMLTAICSGQRIIQTNIGDNELDIVFPKIDYVKTNEELGLYFHVFNSTGYILTGNQADCYVHLYDSLDEHLIKEKAIANGSDYYVSLEKSDINQEGYYSFNIWCNSSTEAGFASSSFYANNKGVYLDGGVYIGLALLILLNLAIFVLLFNIIQKTSIDLTTLPADRLGQAAKTQAILNFMTIFMLSLLNLAACGFTYYYADMINPSLAKMAFIFVLFNVICAIVLVWIFGFKMFTFPFKMIGEYFENRKKSKYRR